MPDCCSPKGYRWVFSERSARAEARRYRRTGLDRTSSQIVDFLKKQGVEGKTLLEVGGGIGAIQVELLKAGASRAISVELTATYEEVAARLLREHGLGDRVERRVMDFAEASADVEGADIVVLNRVICCYPDMPKLTTAAARHASQFLVMSYPRRSWWTRLGLGLSNGLLIVLRREFHIFVHPPQEIMATARREGLEPMLNRQGLLWTIAAMRRVAS